MTWLLDNLDDFLGGEDETARGKERWHRICVCGHQELFHGQRNGGTFGSEDTEYSMYELDGCRGATPSRDEMPMMIDGKTGKGMKDPTCPCMKFRPVAEIDRPARLMRQKVYTKDDVHPMMRGLKAMRTWFTNRDSIKDPEAEMARRFRWIEGAQKCEECGTTSDDVVPRYVRGTRNSEMRCSRHA